MGNKSKLLSIILLVLGIGCIGVYFIYPKDSGKYNVHFNSDGGTEVADQVVNKGEKVNKPADPTKENSEFVEWQLDGVAYVFDNAVLKDMTLVAKWNDIVLHDIKVTLDGQDYTANVKEGNDLTIDSLGIPAKDGYMVKLYNENNEEYDINQPVTADLTLTAKYVEIKTYTVKFDSQGGNKIADVKVEENSQVSEPTVNRDGYTLDGWYLGDEKFDFTTPISKNITLKAKWIENGKINVIFNVDGNVYKTSAVKENTKVTKPSDPTKKGNRFVEWQLNGNAFDFNTKITEEITLTALFEEVSSYTVSFNSDGGSSVKSQEVEAGKKATKPTNPTKKDYVFVEWQLNGKAYDFNKEVNDDLALKAVWEKEQAKWTVKFVDDDGNEIATSQTVVNGEKAAKPTDPKKEGYNFSEWIDENHGTFDFSAPITKNMTLTARFEKILATPVLDTPNPDTGDVENDEEK